MIYRIDLSREAERFFARCDKPLAKKLARCFTALESNPRQGNNIKPLKGSLAGYYRYRVGDCRVVYAVNDQQVIVHVITIAHRGEAYD